jgi:hypothetical protein
MLVNSIGGTSQPAPDSREFKTLNGCRIDGIDINFDMYTIPTVKTCVSDCLTRVLWVSLGQG